MKEKEKHTKGAKEHTPQSQASAETGPQRTLELAQGQLDTLRKKAQERDELWDKYTRLYADYENSKKLWERQKQELLKFGNFRILKEFVSIIDEIEAALLVLKSESQEVAQGLNMIHKKIKEVLTREGLQPVDAVGKIFDPHLHEALLFEERDDLPDHSIIEVIQQGYRYEDKLLRPARVKVSLAPGEKEEEITQAQEQDEQQAQRQDEDLPQVQEGDEEAEAREEK